MIDKGHSEYFKEFKTLNKYFEDEHEEPREEEQEQQ